MAVSNKKLLDAYKKKDAALDESLAAQDKAYAAKISDTQEETADNLQSLYLQRERANALRGQAQKAQGITGGASESAAVAAAANYNASRVDMMLARDRQISELEIQREQARADVGLQKSANQIEMEQSDLSFQTDQRDFSWQKENADRQFEADQKNADRTYNANQQSIRRSEAWEMVRAGIINNEIAATLGYSAAVLKKYYNNYKEMNS